MIKAFNRNIFKLQKRKNVLRNKMVDLSDKKYKEIKRKEVNIFKNTLQKTKQKTFLRDKVPDNQETGKNSRQYS